MPYKLSPSDFKFLWKDCKYCYYQKVKHGLTPPKGAFPGIFAVLNGLLQNHITGLNLRDINPELPNAKVQRTEGWLHSAPVVGAENCYIKGRYDVLCQLDDGTLMVIDFKITNPKAENLAGYGAQLLAYKYALENPADPMVTPREVSQVGLITVSPSDIRLHKGKIVFIANPVWHQFDTNMDSFFSLIKEISALLDGPPPEPNPECKVCQYRQTSQSVLRDENI